MHSPGVIWEVKTLTVAEEGIRPVPVPQERSFLADASRSLEHFGRSVLQSFLFYLGVVAPMHD